MAYTTEDFEEERERLLSIEEDEAYLDLYEHRGMRLLLERIEQLRNGYNRISGVKDVAEFHMNQGRLDILNWVLNWPDMCRQSLEQNKR
jgi:hypothetical protein